MFGDTIDKWYDFFVTKLVVQNPFLFRQTCKKKHHLCFKSNRKIDQTFQVQARSSSWTCKDNFLAVIDLVTSRVIWFLWPQEGCNLICRNSYLIGAVLSLNLSVFIWISLEKFNGLLYWQFTLQIGLRH